MNGNTINGKTIRRKVELYTLYKEPQARKKLKKSTQLKNSLPA